MHSAARSAESLNHGGVANCHAVSTSTTLHACRLPSLLQPRGLEEFGKIMQALPWIVTGSQTGILKGSQTGPCNTEAHLPSLTLPSCTVKTGLQLNQEKIQSFLQFRKSPRPDKHCLYACFYTSRVLYAGALPIEDLLFGNGNSHVHMAAARPCGILQRQFTLAPRCSEVPHNNLNLPHESPKIRVPSIDPK